MASPNQLIAFLVIVVTFLLHGNNNTFVEAQLRADFYNKTCPIFPSLVNETLISYIVDHRIRELPAYALRLFYRDCLVSGCDGSVLLKDISSFNGERPEYLFHNGFYEIIENIKSSVEEACPGVVSCADLLAIIARDSVKIIRGPHWELGFGRRDSRTASQAVEHSNLPPPDSFIPASVFGSTGFRWRVRKDFAAAMTKMSEISPLTGTEGEIRKKCSRIN